MKKLIAIQIVLTFCAIGSRADGTYSSDVGVISAAEGQALQQAHAVLTEGANPEGREALQSAIKDMERAQSDLEAAKKSPEKLPAALAAEQAAYQALLKATPREYRIGRGRNQGQGGGSAQPDQQEIDQVELAKDDNRYETESQATAAPTEQQRQQSAILDRLKQLARRQQDLNERLRDLQNALQEAKNDQDRAEIQRQLKRLRDEEKQMLSDVDDLRQQLEQSPNAEKQTAARQQLDQTHTDVQRAAQQLDHQSVSEALASGSRAEQQLQDLREKMRQQTSSQFTQQMRNLRSQARDLSANENQIAHDLDTLNNSAQKSLDDSAQRQALSSQLAKQQGALTNLLDQMRTVTEQAESTEPLLSKQLYDIIRRADQAHTDSQLDVTSQLVDRGFLPQASQAEQAARTNIDDLKKSVDHAAESILGSETDALKYAQKELNDLASQMGKELQRGTNGNGQPGTNGSPGSSGQPNANGAGNPNEQEASGAQQGAGTAPNPGENSVGSERDRLRQLAQQLGGGAGGLGQNGPITGNTYMDWTDRMRDVEQSVDSQDVRNQLATVREQVGVYRRAFRENGRAPSAEELQKKVLAPLQLARDWVGQELSRTQDDRSLVPLDRDPVQEKYSDMVRKYYEKLGSSQ